MENENIQSVDLETLKAELGEMSREELLELAAKEKKARKDQELFNKKLEKELKEKSEAPEKVVEVPETPAETTAPVLSEDDMIEYSNLVSQGFTKEEIKLAKSFVGTPMGNTMTEVARSAGFMAQVKEKRKVEESASKSIDGLGGLQAPTTDAQFMENVSKGTIDITQKVHRDRFKRIEMQKRKELYSK